jgi:hypothetical protein
LVPGTTIVYEIFFLKVVPGTKCSQKMFRSKNKAIRPIQIPKKTFLNSFLRFLGDLVPVIKVNLEYLNTDLFRSNFF